MRQMVLVCDDSCNSFSTSPPPFFFPLSFLLVSLLVFALKWPRCVTQAEKTRGPPHGYKDTNDELHIWHDFRLLQKLLIITSGILPLQIRQTIKTITRVFIQLWQESATLWLKMSNHGQCTESDIFCHFVVSPFCFCLTTTDKQLSVSST